MSVVRTPLEMLAVLSVVLSFCVLPGCGGEQDYDADDVGVRRYGAPRPSDGEGEEEGAIEIGEAADISKKPSKPETPRRPPLPTVPRGPTRPSAGAGTYEVVAVESGGTIKGTVRFSASPGGRKTIPFTKDQEACEHESQPSQRMIYDEEALTVANCFVYLADITKGKDWEGEYAKGIDDRVAVLDQAECTYVPHILTIRTETQIQIDNSDPAEHNVHIYRGNASGPTQANVLSPAGSSLMPGPAFIEKAAVYEVKCDIHAWMNGYVWAMKHPYFAVTGINGTFELTDVPPGTYRLVMWHEGMKETPQMSGGGISGYDYSKPVEKDAEVTVAAGEEVTHDFTIDAPGQ